MSDCGAPVSDVKKLRNNGYSRTFEPLLAGDRQSEGRVAKPRKPLIKEDRLQSVCCEITAWHWLHVQGACIVCA
jgi:hypothetical protein